MENLHIEIFIAVNLGCPAEHGTLVINSRRRLQTLFWPLHCGAGVAKENIGWNNTTYIGKKQSAIGLNIGG